MKKIGILFTMLALLFAFVSCPGVNDPSGGDDGYFTITFNGNAPGVLNVPAAMRYPAGTIVTIPSPGALSREGYSFLRWNTQPGGGGTNYNAGDTHTLNANLTLFAIWEEIPLVDSARVYRGDVFVGYFDTLQEALGSLTPPPVTYTIHLLASQQITSFTIPTGTNLTLIGEDTPRTIQLLPLPTGAPAGTLNIMFILVGTTLSGGDTIPVHVPDDTTQLTIGNNIILRGRDNNNGPVVNPRNGALFTMLPGSKITGNTVVDGTGFSVGAAVTLNARGRFTMLGGTITDNHNTRSYGRATGGVFVNSGHAADNTAVNLLGGSIIGNTGLNADFAATVNRTTRNTLGGNMTIGRAFMSVIGVAPQATAYFIINPDWTGHIGEINIRGNAITQNVISPTTIPANLAANPTIARPAAGHTLTNADRDRFQSVGIFLSGSGVNSEPLAPRIIQLAPDMGACPTINTSINTIQVRVP